MKCTYDPASLKGEPIGMFHCPECGEMVLVGMPHPDYSLSDYDKLDPIHIDDSHPCVPCFEALLKERDALHSRMVQLKHALGMVACRLADMTTSPDFNKGNLGTYIEVVYEEAKQAIEELYR